MSVLGSVTEVFVFGTLSWAGVAVVLEVPCCSALRFCIVEMLIAVELNSKITELVLVSVAFVLTRGAKLVLKNEIALDSGSS